MLSKIPKRFLTSKAENQERFAMKVLVISNLQVCIVIAR
jgi:hypothetical protein